MAWVEGAPRVDGVSVAYERARIPRGRREGERVSTAYHAGLAGQVMTLLQSLSGT